MDNIEENFDVKQHSVFVPKCLGLENASCRCKEFYKEYYDFYMDYLHLGNVCEKPRTEICLEDRCLIGVFDFDLFSSQLELMYNCMGYVEKSNISDLICTLCKCNYKLPSSYKKRLSFEVMGVCHKEIQKGNEINE